jgi:prepilin signal peptidase PulO-like enzyme (type II secretory pathway)
MTDVNMLLESIRESLHQVAIFLPRLLLAFVIIVAGWLVAKAIRFAVVKALRAINFNVVTEKAGIDHFLQQGGAQFDTVRLLGGLAYWLVILAALMVASSTLEATHVTELIGRIVLFVPKVMLAVVIVVFGAYFARFVAAALTTYLRDSHVGEAALIGRLALYAIMVFVIMIALDQMGLADIIRQAFLILVAGVALGLALAFGLGGQKRAADVIERWSRPADDKEQAARSPSTSSHTKPVL